MLQAGGGGGGGGGGTAETLTFHILCSVHQMPLLFLWPLKLPQL